MCVGSKPKASGAPPSVIDGSAAARDELAMRRRRSGYAALNKTGNRFGDISSPSLTLKTLMGS